VAATVRELTGKGRKAHVRAHAAPIQGHSLGSDLQITAVCCRGQGTDSFAASVIAATRAMPLKQLECLATPCAPMLPATTHNTHVDSLPRLCHNALQGCAADLSLPEQRQQLLQEVGLYCLLGLFVCCGSRMLPHAAMVCDRGWHPLAGHHAASGASATAAAAAAGCHRFF
jgi:hypothetical protein